VIVDSSAAQLAVSVVVVTWNSARVLPAAISALVATVPPPAQLIIVDNASVDSSLSTIERATAGARFPVTIIRNAENRGFAAAANQGIEASDSEFVFLHNPDLRLRPDTLRELADALQTAPDDVAAAGGKLLRATGDDLAPTDIVDSTGIRMTRDGRHLDRGGGEPDRGQWDKPGEVFGVTGAAVLFRRSALLDARVDGEVFDEDFFAYREDADLAWRLRGFGYRAIYVPSALAWHRRTVTPDRRRNLSAVVNRHSVKNRFLLRLHHADRSWLARFGLHALLRDVVVIGACLLVERSSLGAFPWLVRSLSRHRARRAEILRRRSVPGRELNRWFH
jgi:GT2 family glycosyltransferase